ncbi:MAG: B12-binding domain-containing radical SAM protein [Lysobacterales bacterium CG02_land_8_20_14_3_00_62_12]|nr:MAG: B12-binding domain-containing radical SAM protein [Xanthomonadales bacterium CG02_land_8_20_14_3_00_62_12]
MTKIVLSTLNARYPHASLGLRCLRANLGELRADSCLLEFVVGQKTEEMAERILALSPRVLGLGVYIWNVEESTRLVAQLKRLAPQLWIVLGGPEVSHEVDQQRICALADYVVTGWGDISFARLLRDLLAGRPPANRIVVGEQPPLAALALPYAEYTEEDIAKRYIYVEASRGCPFKCEFCLSALDRSAWAFPLAAFLDELATLWARGAREFKFVDRTFNLKIDASLAIIEFFLQRIAATPDDLPYVHFELIPDHLPERLKQAIARFPKGTLQFEIGIQTFDPEVQARIARRQDNAKAETNLRWLKAHSQAHLHVDLIAGLPGENVTTFGQGFDRLVGLAPHEIQFGILKRLRGAPIARHTEAYDLRFNPEPPYNILATADIDFPSMQRLSRFARYWELLANSGRYARSLQLLLAGQPFQHFAEFGDWLYRHTAQTHAFAHERMVHLVYDYLTVARGLPAAEVATALIADYRGCGGRSRLAFEATDSSLPPPRDTGKRSATPSRQIRHLDARNAS